MGFNDHIHNSELSNLPHEAFDPFNVDGPFDPQDNWLEVASEDDQLIAMRAWFYARYCDPAHETPYNGKEGGYIFIHGGPYDPGDVLHERFLGIVNDSLIDSLVEELYDEVGERWAPIRYEFEDEFYYDDRLAFIVDEPVAPLNGLITRIKEALSVLDLTGNVAAQELAITLVYGAVFSILETFLSETVEYWIENDEQIFRRIVTRLPELNVRKLTLQEIFDRHDGLKKEVKGYLQGIVWHRWDKSVAPLLRAGFEIDPPLFTPFEEFIVKRHHIVHRSGQDHDGNPVKVTKEEVQDLCNLIEAFASEIQHKILEKMQPINKVKS